MAAQPQPDFLSITGVTGRNGSDAHFSIPDSQCLEAMNIDWFRVGLMRRRGGSKVIGLTGGTAFNNVRALYRHLPADDETVAEFWGVDSSFLVKRLVGGVAWANVNTTVDPITSNPERVVFRSFNGKLYAAYKSGLNRLHVWDGTAWRRVGVHAPVAPGNGGTVAGAVTDTRQYRVTYDVQDGSGFTIRRSNLGDPINITLAAQNVTLTKPAAVSEGETHWSLWAASVTSGFGDFRLLGTVTVATPNILDNFAALPATVAPALGANTPPPSAKYITSDDARLIMCGAWESTASPFDGSLAPNKFAVWWTSIITDVSNVGNDERVSNTGTINNYTTLDEAPTGITPPMLSTDTSAGSSLDRGTFYVFSASSHYRFTQTGQVTAPYQVLKIQGGKGCIFHQSIVVAEDSDGHPTVYWAAKEGFYRITPTAGQQYCGEDVVDIWATVNLDATVPCHGVFYPDLHQIWYWVATNGSNFPNTKLIYDTRLGRFTETSGVRGGWAVGSGEQANAACSAMFSDTIGASMGRRLKPHIGYTGNTTDIWKCDTADFDDNGNLFQAYMDTKSYIPWGPGRRGGIRHEPTIVARALAGTTVTVKTYWREGGDDLNGIADLTPESDSGLETHVFPLVNGAKLSDSDTYRFRIGDDTARSVGQWMIDALVVPISNQGER